MPWLKHGIWGVVIHPSMVIRTMGLKISPFLKQVHFSSDPNLKQDSDIASEYHLEVYMHIYSDILSSIYFDILPDILASILTFFLAFYLAFSLASG